MPLSSFSRTIENSSAITSHIEQDNFGLANHIQIDGLRITVIVGLNTMGSYHATHNLTSLIEKIIVNSSFLIWDISQFDAEKNVMIWSLTDLIVPVRYYLLYFQEMIPDVIVDI